MERQNEQDSSSSSAARSSTRSTITNPLRQQSAQFSLRELGRGGALAGLFPTIPSELREENDEELVRAAAVGFTTRTIKSSSVPPSPPNDLEAGGGEKEAAVGTTSSRISFSNQLPRVSISPRGQQDMRSSNLPMSVETEQGIELLAHAVAQEAHAAQAAARAEALSGDDHLDMMRTPLSLAISEISRQDSNSNLHGISSIHRRHSHNNGGGGRKGTAVLTAKQQYVRTLMLPKEGERIQTEMAVKDFLRYIQNAVRMMHITQQNQLNASVGAASRKDSGAIVTLSTPPAQQQASPFIPTTAAVDPPPPTTTATTSSNSNHSSTTSPPPATTTSTTTSTDNNSNDNNDEMINHDSTTPIATNSTINLPTTTSTGTNNVFINNPQGCGFTRTRSLSCGPAMQGIAATAAGLGGTTRMSMPFMNAPAAPQTAAVLNARDVRRLITGLDSESSKNKEMSVAVRRHTIVLNLDDIRCLVLWDRLLVVIPEGADSQCFGQLEENLRWLRLQKKAFQMEDDEDEEEFELLALEAVLMTIVGSFRKKLKDLRPLITKNAKALLGINTLNAKHQDILRHLKTKVAGYQAKVRSLHKALFDLLDDEDHVQMLHLTKVVMQTENEPSIYALDGGEREDEAEILLESYLGDVNEIIMKWELLKEEMQNTEDFVQMQLDMARNKLLTIGTLFALVNLCFAFGSLISGIFGMNLFNGISTSSGPPESFVGFTGVVGTISCVCFLFGGGMLFYMYMARILVT